MKVLYFFLLLFLISINSNAQNLEVDPYLEHAEPTHIHISWVTDTGLESKIEWGLNETLGSETTGGYFETLFGDIIHEVELNGLTPNTKYFYQVVTGSLTSNIYDFVTPPDVVSEQSFNLVAMSDMQIDFGNPNRFSEIVNQGIIPVITEEYGSDLSANLGFVLIPGDLVDNGLNYNSWKDEFFEPGSDLFSKVPVYPVLGNHEVNSQYYFDFFHLPLNGTETYEEHWYYKDYSNVRIIGLDSNSPYDNAGQLIWLENLLAQTCSNPDIDFVFAQIHHPHLSEMWPPGESNFTTSVVERLEDFSTDCGKPSIHFYGHTHSYARGQSKDHDHLMVNVASAGGNIDYWGEYSQPDYEDVTVGQDDYGFVLLEVQAGDDPQFVLKRFSQGNEFVNYDNVVRDSILVKKNNQIPIQPIGVSPNLETVNPNCLLLIGSAFNDPDFDIHMASEWEISTDLSDFNDPVYSAYRNHENWYNNENLQAGDILNDEKVNGLGANTTYYWRVRYRDFSLGWSSWSSPLEFNTGDLSQSENLLTNPGAENGNSNWTVVTGNLESLTAGECDGTIPNSGSYYFGVGGLCDDQPFGESFQAIDLSTYEIEINTGLGFAKFGGNLSDYAGDDIPEVQLEFLDNTGAFIEFSDPISTNSSSWTLVEEIVSIPVGTSSVKFIIRGYRNAGADNDSYIDDLFLHFLDELCDDSIFDEDADGIIDSIDNCISIPNPNQNDFNEDGIGDLCQDTDEDGILDEEEIQTYGTNPSEADSDFDGLSDFEEIFTFNTNPIFQDSDGDGLSDYLELNTSFTDPNNEDSHSDGCTDDLFFGQLCAWQQNCEVDTNGDNVINILDLINISSSFGSVCE